MIDRIKRMSSTFAMIYGKQPTGLFIPACQAPDFIEECNRMCGEIVAPGLIIDSFLGMTVKLCTGTSVGVGVIRPDGTTPPHNVVFEEFK
jgi:hypothetical protein